VANAYGVTACVVDRGGGMLAGCFAYRESDCSLARAMDDRI